MGKRLMTLADLYNYYSTQGTNQTFSCSDSNEDIVVQVDGKLNYSKDDAREGLYPVNLQMCFVGDNLNGSRITTNSMKKALSSAKFRPILGYIHEDENGEAHFGDHRMHTDDNGRLVYDEIPVGVISEEATLSYDEENKKDYAYSNGYIFEDYTRAIEILERQGRCDVSVELAIRELSYNSEDQILCLDDFFFAGCTILECNEDGTKVNPAMPGSNITLADFSAEVNYDQNEELIKAIEKLNNTLECFNIDTTTRKEETHSVEDNKELMEDIETVDAPVIEEINDDATEEETTTETVEALEEETPEVADGEDEEEVAEKTDSENFTEEDDDDKLHYSLTVGDVKKEFAVSLADKQYAIESLVNETYGELDNDYYMADVFEDDGFVVMHGMFSNKHYRQAFKCKKKNYSLVGDRIPVFAQFLTEDEINTLESMKANYSEATDKLAKYESEPEKIEILNSDDYKSVATTEEFAELNNRDTYFDMSVEDIKAKADEILLQYAKSGNLNFSAETENKEVGIKIIPTEKPAKRGRYGGLSKKEK